MADDPHRKDDDELGDVLPIRPRADSEPPLEPAAEAFARAFGDRRDPRAAVDPFVAGILRRKRVQAAEDVQARLEDQRSRERSTAEEQALAVQWSLEHRAAQQATQQAASLEHEAQLLRDQRFAWTVRLALGAFAGGLVAGVLAAWWLGREVDA